MDVLNELERLLREAAQQGGRVPQPRRQPPARQVTDAEIVDADLLHEDVTEHVAECLDTGDVSREVERLARHASQLGSQVTQADEKLEDHLHQEFDHDLGKIHDPSVTAAAEQERRKAVALTAGDIVGMLSNAKSISQAVVLNEVLQRPVDRW